MEKLEHKVNKMKENQRKVWPIVLCLLLAAGLYVFLLNMEIRQLAEFEKGNVIVAVENIVENTEITKENLSLLFTVEERTLTEIPQAACMDLDDLTGQYVQGNIDKGSVITESMLGTLKAKQEDSVLLGINMESLAQSVVGTLRAGDKIEIYTVKTVEEKEVVVEKAIANVTVERSYTGSGASILKEDNTSIAQYITIPVHKDAVGVVYEALENRRIEIVKILD